MQNRVQGGRYVCKEAGAGARGRKYVRARELRAGILRMEHVSCLTEPCQERECGLSQQWSNTSEQLLESRGVLRASRIIGESGKVGVC